MTLRLHMFDVDGPQDAERALCGYDLAPPHVTNFIFYSCTENAHARLTCQRCRKVLRQHLDEDAANILLEDEEERQCSPGNPADYGDST